MRPSPGDPKMAAGTAQKWRSEDRGVRAAGEGPVVHAGTSRTEQTTWMGARGWRPVLPQGRLALVTLLASLALLAGPWPCAAGPHENAVLIAHVNPTIEYTSATSDYTGQSNLRDCRDAIVQGAVDPERGQVWFVIACFANSPGPVAVTAIDFGLGSFSQSGILFADSGQCFGNVLEMASSPAWPTSNEGVALALQQPVTPLTKQVLEVYWFASYVYSPVTIPLTVNPTVQTAGVLDASSPNRVHDLIDEFGSIGFGRPGENPMNPDPQDDQGACCLAGTCELATADECSSAGGYYVGDLTVCFPDPCPEPVETTWSELKQMYQ